MGKIVKLFIFLLLSCTILWGAVPYTKQLEQYDVQMKNASNDELLRIFHGLKSIYIQSIISGDDVLKKETLTRLIKSAKQLNLDASKYESELKTLQRVQPSVKKEEKNIDKIETKNNSKDNEIPIIIEEKQNEEKEKNKSIKINNVFVLYRAALYHL